MSYSSSSEVPSSLQERVQRDPAYGAYGVLRVGFIVLPLLMGADKFMNLLTEWPDYLAPWIADIAPFSAQTTMYIVGVIEVLAAIAMVFRPRWAAWVVAAWLFGIIINLVTYPGYFDVAMRDVGLMVGAIALGLLARKYDR